MPNKLLEDARDILDSLLQTTQNSTFHQRVTEAYVNVSRGVEELKKTISDRENAFQQQLIHEAMKATWASTADVEKAIVSENPASHLISIRPTDKFEGFELTDALFQTKTIPIAAITVPANAAEKQITLNSITIIDGGLKISFGPDDRFYSVETASLLAVEEPS
jgi:hypothetical protein